MNTRPNTTVIDRKASSGLRWPSLAESTARAMLALLMSSAVRVERRRRAETALDHHAVSVTEIAVTRQTVNGVALLAASEHIAGDREGQLVGLLPVLLAREQQRVVSQL